MGVCVEGILNQQYWNNSKWGNPTAMGSYCSEPLLQGAMALRNHEAAVEVADMWDC